jgi:hypothetical protein
VPDVFGPIGSVEWVQAEWYRDAPSWAPSGVFGPPGNGVAAGDLPLTVNGLTVSIGLGRAHLRGAGYERTGTPWTTAIPANTNASQGRRDRLVLRRDLAAATVTIAHLQGTPAGTPTAPALTRVENGTWETPLFAFTVPPNSGTTLGSITDERQWVDPNGGGWYPAVAEVRRAAVQSIPVNTWTVLAFDAEDLDTWGLHSGGRWTAPAPCLVSAVGAWSWAVVAGNTAQTPRGIRLQKNGAPVKTSTINRLFANDAGNQYLPSKPAQVHLAAGDYLEIGVYQNCGIALNTNHQADFDPSLSVTVLGWL